MFNEVLNVFSGAMYKLLKLSLPLNNGGDTAHFQ